MANEQQKPKKYSTKNDLQEIIESKKCSTKIIQPGNDFMDKFYSENF